MYSTGTRGILPRPLWALAVQSIDALGPGYLSVDALGAVLVRYVGSGAEEASWCFGAVGQEQGWLPADMLFALPDDKVAWSGTPEVPTKYISGSPHQATRERDCPLVPLFAVAREAIPGQAAGYLQVAEGEAVEILFLGQEGSDAEGWCHAFSLLDTQDCGWVRSQSLVTVCQ